MCLLTFFPEYTQPDVDALFNGAIVNNDGHGWAIASDSGLLIGHSMSEVDAIEAFAVARSQHPDGPALFHSRFTTDGVSAIDNCHPFYVGADRRTVLAHNGILPNNVRPKKGDRRSDTRIAAERYIPSLGSLRHRSTRLKVERWMGDWNKIAILSVNPKYRERAYLLNEEAGTWVKGIWYSNDGYLPYVSTHLGGGWSVGGGVRVIGSARRAKNVFSDWPVECRICDAFIDPEDDVCPYCNCCTDCNQDARACLCYTPMALARTSTEMPETVNVLGWPKDETEDDGDAPWRKDIEPHWLRPTGWPGAGD